MGAMMGRPADIEDLDRFRAEIPKPLPDGSYSIESMGRWVDRFLGDGKAQRDAAAALASIVMSDDEEAPDPEPVDVPAPIPGGTEPATRGSDPPPLEHR